MDYHAATKEILDRLLNEGLLLTFYEQSASDPAREALRLECLDRLLEQRVVETRDLLEKVDLS